MKGQRFILLFCLGWLLISCGKSRQQEELERLAAIDIVLPEAAQKRAKDFLVLYNHKESDKLAVTVEYFQELTEWALSLRARSQALSQEYALYREKELPFTATQLDKTRQGMLEQLGLKQSVYRLITSYSAWIKDQDFKEPLLTAEVRLKGVMLTLAGALLLYDNFAYSLIHFQQNAHLRRLMNAKDQGYKLPKDQLYRSFREFASPGNRQRVRLAQDYLEERQELLKKMKKTDRQVVWLELLIQQSPSSVKIKEDSRVGDYARMLGLYSTAGLDKINVMGWEIMNASSKLFGNTVGLVQSRRGKLFDNATELKKIRKQLKPLDILLEKTPFRLTDKLIPGHFGHVAIWLGDEKELKEAGLWQHPIVKPHQEKIRAGCCVLEALRDGVQLNTLEHFMNVDDVCVLRPEKISDRKGTFVRAFRQLGKSYDFNFDVNTTDRIVCSELAYMVYTDFKWETERTVGRSTISPDNVARKVLEGKGMSLVIFYHDGLDLSNEAYKIFKEKLEN